MKIYIGNQYWEVFNARTVDCFNLEFKYFFYWPNTLITMSRNYELKIYGHGDLFFRYFSNDNILYERTIK